MAYDPVTQATLDDLTRRRAAMQAGPESYAQFWHNQMPYVQNPSAMGSPQTVADWQRRVSDPTNTVGYQPFTAAGLQGGVAGMADWLRQNWYPTAVQTGQVTGNPADYYNAIGDAQYQAGVQGEASARSRQAMTTNGDGGGGGTGGTGPSYYDISGNPYANTGFAFWEQPEGWYQGDPNAPEGSNISFFGTQSPWALSQTNRDGSGRTTPASNRNIPSQIVGRPGSQAVTPRGGITPSTGGAPGGVNPFAGGQSNQWVNPNQNIPDTGQNQPPTNFTPEQWYTGAGPALSQFWLQNILPNFFRTQAQNAGQVDNMLGFLGQYNPAALMEYLGPLLGQMNANPFSSLQRGLFGGLSGEGAQTMNPFWNSQAGNLNFLAQFGFPGNQQLQTEQANLGNLSNQMLGINSLGRQVGYGLPQFYSQILQGGFPYQHDIENLVPSQLPFGQGQQTAAGQTAANLGQGITPTTGVQGDVTNYIQNMIRGGGLSPEYVSALQNLVFDPQREQFMGRINRLAGGQAALTSPAYGEMMRRQERDFNDQLIRASFENMGNLLNQGMTAGGQAFGQGLNLAQLQGNLGQSALGNAMSAYGLIPSTVTPFAGQMGGFTSDLMNQGLNRFGTGGSLGLQNLQTIQNLAMQPYLFNQQGQQQAFTAGSNLLNQLLGGNLGMMDQLLRQYQLQGSGVMDIINSANQAGSATWLQNLVAQMNSDIARSQGMGAAFGQLFSRQPQIGWSNWPNPNAGGGGSGTPSSGSWGRPGGLGIPRWNPGWSTGPINPGGGGWGGGDGGGGGTGHPGGNVFDWNYYLSTGRLEDYLRWLGTLDEHL